MTEPALFTSFRMRDVTLANRIVVSPMGMHSAVDGVAGDWHLMHLGQFAVSGAGLVITEAVAVEPRGRVSRFCLGLWNEAQIEGLKRVLGFCRQHGSARFGIQLNHSGRKGSVGTSWEGQKAVVPADGGWELLGPSALAYPGRNLPKAMDKGEIARTIDDFAGAASRADQAGFDLIELHAAHGYLLHNFLSPVTNRRDDDYGGSAEGRMRFVLEVFDAVRAAFPAGKVVGVRVSATDWIEGGWNEAETVALSRALAARGCDYMCVSSGGIAPEQQITVGPLYQVPFSERVRKEAHIPTMAVGLITQAADANAIVAEGRADLVALARGMLYNPRWAWHAAEELGAEAAFPVQYDRAHPSMRDSAAFNFYRERKAGG